MMIVIISYLILIVMMVKHKEIYQFTQNGSNVMRSFRRSVSTKFGKCFVVPYRVQLVKDNMEKFF
jgi:hypothetical protein